MKVDTLDKSLVSKIVFSIASGKVRITEEADTFGGLSFARSYQLLDEEGETLINLHINDNNRDGKSILRIYDTKNRVTTVSYEEERGEVYPAKVNGGEKNPKSPKSPIAQIEEAFIKRYNFLQHEKAATEKSKKETKAKADKMAQKEAQNMAIKRLEKIFSK